MSLGDIKFYYVHQLNSAKEMWDTLEMIHGVSSSIEQEDMNTRGEYDEDVNLKCFLKNRNVRIYIGTFITNQCLRVKDRKLNPILKSKI